MSEERFMQRALQLASLGIGPTSPNPSVGCVVVHEGKIIGEGFTSPYGGPHAEVNAINSVSDQSLLADSTVYVTLEPCAHFGKTPPCADLLVRMQVKKVVIACRDPFEEVDGKGIEKLENGGVEVELGMLEKEALEMNRRFFTFHLHNRPYVILKWAQTSDGFIARKNYDSKWISNPYSRQMVHKWRAEEDAILVGKNTAIYDNPSLNVRDWKGKNPVRVLLDSNLEVPNDYHLFDDSVKTLILNLQKNEVRENVHWIKVDTIDPTSILQILYEHRIQSVIVEGGSQVLNSFIAENCWDEARVFQSEEKFESGITAPSINKSSLKFSKFIAKDKLEILINR